METSNMYKRVIDILTSDNVNYYEIAIHIAKNNPEVFVGAYDELHSENVPLPSASQYFIDRNGVDFINSVDIDPLLFNALIEKYGYDSWLRELIKLLFPLSSHQRETIRAIKHVRQETGMGLKEAKGFVDTILSNNVPDIEKYLD